MLPVLRSAKLILLQFFDTVALQAIYRFKILQAIPINGAVSYGDLARSSGMNEDVMRRLLRRAMSFGFLDETDGRVCHTKNSAYMIQRPNYIDMLGFFAEYDFRSSASIVDTIQMHPKPEEPTATPFNTAFQNDEIYHNYMGRDAARNSIFSGFMKAIGSDPGLKTEHIVRGYSWAELGEATIVDVSISAGHGRY